MATVAVTAVGAVQAIAVQLQVVGFNVMTMLVLEPELAAQSARVVLTVSVTVVCAVITEGYLSVSIVNVFEPDVTLESVMVAQVVMLLPLESSIAKFREPHRSLRGDAAVSTASVGITNSEVAVLPSVTVIDVGLNVIWLTVVEVQGFATVRV